MDALGRRSWLVVILGSVVALVPGGVADALPRHEFGGTECSIIEQTGVGGIGLATDIPRVYARNYRRGVRDRQVAAFRSDLEQWQTDRWMRVATGNLYRAVVADDNYAIAWWNTVTRAYEHFPSQRHEWVLQQSGSYRVVQRIVWYRRGKPPRKVEARTAWTVVDHSPRAPNGGNFCFIP